MQKAIIFIWLWASGLASTAFSRYPTKDRTVWRVAPSLKYDALSFISVLSGDESYTRLYPKEFARFGSKIPVGASGAYLNRINPATRNTFIVFNQRRVADKFVNLEFTTSNQALLGAAIKRARDETSLYVRSSRGIR